MNKSIPLLCALLVLSPAVQALDATEKKIVAAVDADNEAAIAFLKKAVEINSGTHNIDGIRKVGALFEAELKGLGFSTRWAELPKEMGRAGHLIAEKDGGKGPRILLIGHLDTVFEKDSPFQRFEADGDTAHGPGTSDMKGGLVAIVHALKALQAAGALDGARLTLVFIGDEEDPGDPLAVTRAPLVEAGKKADIALGFENAVGSLRTGTVTRRGISEWELKVEAVQGHSSQIFSEKYGAGANYALADILSRFYKRMKGRKYLTFNAGLIAGGVDAGIDPSYAAASTKGKRNVIAPTAVAAGDLRTLSIAQREKA